MSKQFEIQRNQTLFGRKVARLRKNLALNHEP
jgi:hypothetical protein